MEQSASTLTIFASSQEGGASRTLVYPLDSRAEKIQVADSVMNTETKWEGAALLVNAIVTGPQNYTVMERWQRRRDGSSLTITRTIVRAGGESESVLVYENSARAPMQLQTRQETRQPEVRPAPLPLPLVESRRQPAPEEYVVAAGTRILLRLTNSVNTKRTAVGDHVYLETAVPIFVSERLVIPQGSYVNGVVTESKQAGRVKGRSALNVQFESITLRNGVVRDLRSRAGSVDARGNLDRTEGRIEGEGNKGGDTATVAKTTAAGTGVGAIAGGAAGHLGMGAGIGAAAGALGGLAGVLGSRGPEVVLPAGTTMEMVLDRDLRFTPSDLQGR